MRHRLKVLVPLGLLWRFAWWWGMAVIVVGAAVVWAGEIKTPEYTDTEAVAAINAAGLSLADAKGLLFDTQPASDQTYSPVQSFTGTAGENLAIGDLVTLRTNGTWYKADADTTALSIGPLGIATAAINAAASGVILLEGWWRNDTPFAFTIGQPVYVDTIAGGMTQTEVSGQTGNVVRVIGQGWETADILRLRPATEWGVR